MDNVELVKQGYKLFAAGDIEGVSALFHPEIEWNASQGLPYIEGDGVFIGFSSILQNVFAKIPENLDGFHIDIRELFGSGDKVVMVGQYKGVYKPTGKEFNANATHVWTVKDGKATHYFQAVDTAEMVNP
jgi:ketosteroid isomerase-like protein